MFKRILIANRGEIAVRVFRACREMDIEPVVVYSQADREALHVQLAERAYCIGPARSADSYLNVDAILTVPQATGCDAIHPGYGFLSENAEFADACEAAGITFIGPSGDVIRAMGNKAAARKLMQQAGVPVVPGSDGAVDTAEQAKALADSIRLLNDAAPTDKVLAIKSLEALQKVADGKATKIIIPSEMQGLVGLANGIVEGTKE